MCDFNFGKLYKKLNDLTSWEEWELFESEFFDIERWVEKNEDMLIEEQKIEPINLNGIKWEHVVSFYDLSPDYEYMYEYCLNYVFKKLDNESYTINTNIQGKWCVYCKRYAKCSNLRNCPFCQHDLFNYPLND